MINESMAVQNADVAVISENRYNDFKIVDAKPYADAVSGMKALDNQAESVINLHKESVKNHYEILSSITDTLQCEDDPFGSFKNFGYFFVFCCLCPNIVVLA